MKLITILTPCFNEEENVEMLYHSVKAVMAELPGYQYQHLFIDNNSSDRTIEIIKRLGSDDGNVKLIANIRNFGVLRSGMHGFLQARGDAVIILCADFQDPPELIKSFVSKWEEGYKVVAGVKPTSRESRVMFFTRTMYYKFLRRISETPLVENFTGFGLYDRSVIEIIRGLDDPYPYLRGLISELGFPVARIPYSQPKRIRGNSKNNLYDLFDVAMLGITSHSKIPLRLATFLGLIVSIFSFLVASGYLIYKLIYWENFEVGMAPLIVGFFFFTAVQLVFIGILGEYVGFIHTQVLRRPLVVEKERVNLD